MQKKIRYPLLSVFVCLILGAACSESPSGGGTAPSQVQLVPKSPDGDTLDAGIDAESYDGAPLHQNGIYLEWFRLNDNDIEAFYVYRRVVDTTGNFTRVGTVIQPLGQVDTTFLDTSVVNARTYYYYVTAVNKDNLESDPSKIDAYRLLPAPEPSGTLVVTAADIRFSWQFDANGIPNDFFFRLERQLDRFRVVGVRNLDTIANVNVDQNRTLNEVGFSALTPGTYRWRIEMSENREGAESRWEIFTVN